MIDNNITTRIKIIQFRVKEEEKKVIDKRIKHLGFSNMSQYLRYVVNKDLKEA